ncbi:hypothetical protein VOLCADRAFT_98246 [Volvox carteri f. nagariensis]|uniref:Plus3 domain-containing protein n=1 Tax=Volvox carteri f. nagariensis TaxID=3068 RepID=D8UEY2_VOLCA|nr:uncharacterized protein VOLCADRAFT_98246 [Volvox carteri f. nagariensis]EFJ41673.1 hypothetical protein VOLCADRAFT_98246 [Volvox carteri f. nagariensis]|eukprot:XP_002957175.1 hypothetical protein VOLCADRAFT_98246 [Volvox carteri f. nagariensis]
MADDLDDALFSLGAGSNKASSTKRNRKASDSDEDGAIDSDADSEEAPRRKKASKGSSSKRGKKPQSDEDDGDDDGDFDDEEGLYENEEDRRKLMGMTELEREMILAERAEMRDKERQRRQLLQQQRVATEKADKGRRKHDKQDGTRGKGTPRSKSARSAGALRGARDWSDRDSEGGAGSSGDEEEAAGWGGGMDGAGGFGGGGGAAAVGAGAAAGVPAVGGGSTWGSEPAEDGRRQAAAAAAARSKERERERLRERERHLSDDEEAPEEATLEELLTCQVTRIQLEEWFTQPFFERDALSGCVVRMAYGPGMRDASGNTHPGYMIMEITDIRESGRGYSFGSRGEITHKHLALRDGLGITRVMAMANFDEAEYERYKRHCGRASRAPITREEAAAAARKVEAATNYRWTSADLKLELERKRASRAAPVNPAAEKAMLKRRMELAAAAGNMDEVAVLEEQLSSLESHLLNQNNNKRAFGMMDLNKRNKQHNLTVAYKTSAAEEHGGNDGSGGADVFSRRATTLNIYWNTKGARGRDGSSGGGDRPSAGAAAAARAQASLPDKLTRAQQRMDPADLIRHLDLDVDLTLLRTAAVVPSLQLRVLPPRWRAAALAAHAQDLAGKSVLTIADWKRRAGEY